MRCILLTISLFWCFSWITAFAHFPAKEELYELCHLDDQDEAERRLHEQLRCHNYEDGVNLFRWFTTAIDERPFSYPSFFFISSGNQRLTRLLINRMSDIINQPVLMPLHEPLLHTLINTDLFYSVSVGNLERVLFLLNQHPRQARILDHNRHSLLSYAVRHGHDDIIRSLWASLMPDFPDIDGNNLMHLAVQYNQTSTIRLLLSLGYPLNNRNRRGETPLFQSVLEGHEFATRQLLSQGANPDIADNTSQRPLQIAFARGHTNQVISLIEHQLAPIENALGRYMDIQTAETEAIAVNCLIGHSSADNTFTNGVYGHSLIRSPHRQNLLRLCQNLRSQAGQLAQALLLNQATQQSLFHDLQLRGPEHQNRLEEQRQQLQAFRERLQQVLQRLQNDLQRIRQNACNGQAR